MKIILLTQFLVVALPVSAQDMAPGFPGFRHVDAGTGLKSANDQAMVHLLADADFAPWSFKAADGSLQGISVDMAKAACVAAGLSCEVKARPYAELLPSLRGSEVDGIVSGPAPDAALATEFALTRPYFMSLGRFLVRKGSALAAADIRTLAGKRLGVVGKSTHARFLEQHYGRSAITPYDSSDAMLEALRTGKLDAVFGDAVQMSFWLKGSTARNCCDVLGKAFVHRATFTRSLGFILRRDRPQLRDALDGGLDQLEKTQATAAIFARYLPSPVW